jgi:hypothetical protein
VASSELPGDFIKVVGIIADRSDLNSDGNSGIALNAYAGTTGDEVDVISNGDNMYLKWRISDPKGQEAENF